jgi:hypothetical protein
MNKHVFVVPRTHPLLTVHSFELTHDFAVTIKFIGDVEDANVVKVFWKVYRRAKSNGDICHLRKTKGRGRI